MSDASPTVQLQRICRSFGVGEGDQDGGDTIIRAVDDVTLDIPCGALTVLMGPSGSGKTTLLSLIGGLLAPTSGTVTVDGTALGTLSQPALTAFRLQRVGIVFQAFHLIDALDAVENIELPLTLAGVARPASRRRALHLAERMGLEGRLRAHPRSLSGGEKQRVALARALANEPAIILADEPTGSLDAQAGEAVIALLHAEAIERGRAVIVASHDPRLQRHAERVVRMDFGRVVAVS